MTLSIITINYNNAQGLLKTLNSVLAQTCTDFEHIIVDGASTDNAVEIIQQYEKDATARGIKVVWVSEKDKGIYNAMNKGIKMASGECIQILNSGDCLAADTVVADMFSALKEKEYPEILYGNMLKTVDWKTY
jgi:glycosyltransferase involved in cell wall biosynthesis